MVAPGQFLERPTLIPVTKTLVLEGVSHRGTLAPPLLVLPPPPVEGSGMDHVVAAELAWAVSHAGHPTLRFNFRGVGASQGKRSSQPAHLLADATAALEVLRDNANGQVPAVASLGASDALALELARRGLIAAAALINPSLVRPAELPGFGTCPVCVVLPELDERFDRPAWASAALPREDTVDVIPGATSTYQRNLPMVGKAVVALLARAARLR